MPTELAEEGRRRVMIERVRPEIDCGRFPAKRIVGDEVVVEATAFADGHDALRCVLRYRREEDDSWREAEMEPLGNDGWRGSFAVDRVGRYRFTVVAWVDRFLTWREEMTARIEAGQDLTQPLLVGARLIDEAADRLGEAGDESAQRGRLERWAARLRALSAGESADAEAVAAEAPGGTAERRETESGPDGGRVTGGRAAGGGAAPSGTGAGPRVALDLELARLMRIHGPRDFGTTYGKQLPVMVDRERARFSAWYELFPRSAGPEPGGAHGTFEDVESLLPYIARMGFDVVYLPPIHPIGHTERKGPNNSVAAGPSDPGSPWGIGGAGGGHKAIHPELGTPEEFRRLVRRTREHGMEIALDVAFQCSPDHPWVTEHPEWFRKRPDGSIQFAENPPKKYQDIYPLDFETDAWRSLWTELETVFEHWIGEGVRIFRVDNPHTKPFAFWEWLIDRIKRRHPDVLLLSEAFTRPAPMYRLAKLGFTQSYTYFTWRNRKEELQRYVEELTGTEVREYFRPNFWPNTPDILHEYLQTGGRAAFVTRLVLAATLSSNYGIYGPAYELQASTPRESGSEEYLHSEKYELRSWDLDREDSLRSLITRINRVRQAHPALQQTNDVVFHATDNDHLLAFSKHAADGEDTILVIVNLDPHHVRAGWLDLRLDALPVQKDEPYVVEDLLGGQRFDWRGCRNYVELDPGIVPAHVLHVRPAPRPTTAPA